jgi:hypothetical protein
MGIFPINNLEKKYIKNRKHRPITIMLSKFVEKV